MLNGEPEAMRKALPYMTKAKREHSRYIAMTGVAGFFADPHSAWPRGSNAIPNGRLREYRPEGTDWSGHSQDDLNVMAGCVTIDRVRRMAAVPRCRCTTIGYKGTQRPDTAIH